MQFDGQELTALLFYDLPLLTEDLVDDLDELITVEALERI